MGSSSNPTVATSSLLNPEEPLAMASRTGVPLSTLREEEEDTKHLPPLEARALLTRGKSKRCSRNKEKCSSIRCNMELFLLGECKQMAMHYLFT
mmetsp:Transcript_28034/g.39144  ORF Transcript_28034/g.39144 Transcript_28034/m.39144 type:complete len:94 (-) Transcript_28034:228-509(-)